MKWLALTFGGPSCASTHFRIHQYVPLLLEHGIELVCRPAAELDDIPDFTGFDGILLQKKLLSGPRRRRLARSGLPVVFDIDDATWHPLEKKHHFITRWRTARRLSATLKLCKLALPANLYLAEHLRHHLGNVQILPMTLPLRDWQTVPNRKGPLVIGWAGAPGNHFQLRSIEAALRDVKQAMPEIIIRIFSGVRPEMDVEIDFVPFQPDQQIDVLHSFSIGLLPLPDTPFNHGKSPIKALQYIAAGIPCVAAALSGTVEMLGDEASGALYATDMASWTNNLLKLAREESLRMQMGQAGRSRYQSQFTAESVAARLASFLRQTAT